MDSPYGYRYDLEDIVAMDAGAQVTETTDFGAFDPFELGAPMGMMDVLKHEHQLRLNSCTGNSFTTCVEASIYHESGGQVQVQLSRMFAYVNGQRYSHNVGDTGASLWGVLQGGINDGVPLEQYGPYTGYYYTKFTQEAYQRAKDYKIGAYVKIKSADQVYQFLANRMGAIFFGFSWCGQFKSPLPGGNVDTFKSTSNEHHAVCGIDWCTERDKDGYPRIRVMNSHSEQAGDHNSTKWSYAAMQQALEQRDTVAYGVSSAQFIKPRFDWKKARWTDVEG